MRPDEALYEENQELRRERDDARRWAAAWKESAKANRDAYQGAHFNYQEAMRQYNEQQKRACEAEALLKEQPCGHPVAAISRNRATQYCRWCEDVDRARAIGWNEAQGD